MTHFPNYLSSLSAEDASDDSLPRPEGGGPCDVPPRAACRWKEGKLLF